MNIAYLVEYAQCVKMLGNGRLEAKCQDGETRLGQIRGQMRKKVGLVQSCFLVRVRMEDSFGVAHGSGKPLFPWRSDERVGEEDGPVRGLCS